MIAVGGSAFSPAALQWNPGRQAREYARQLRCMSERTDDIVRCLRVKDWQTLIAAQRSSHNFEKNTFRHWFRPVLDRNSTFSLLRDHPSQLYAMGQFLRVPLMLGVSSHEGSLEFFIHWNQLRPMSSLERLRFLINPYLYEFARSEIIATTLNYNYVSRYNSTGYAVSAGSHFHHNGQQVNSLNTPILLANRQTSDGQFWHAQNIGFERNEYDVYISPNDHRSKEIVRQIDAVGDFLYVAPAIRQLELHSQSVSQTYMFVFDYKGSRSFGHIQLNPYGRALNIDGEVQTNGWLPSIPTSTGAIISTETSNFGVAHCDDLFYVLPNDFAPIIPNSPEASNLNDDNAIRSYVTYLVAFASRINEQNSVSNNLANWLPFRQTDRNYIRFSDQLPTLYKGFHQTDVNFVNELVEPIEELVNTPLPLFPYEELRDLKVSTIALALLLLLIVLTLLIVLIKTICRRGRKRREPFSSLVPSSPDTKLIGINSFPATSSIQDNQQQQQQHQQQQQQYQPQTTATEATNEHHAAPSTSYHDDVRSISHRPVLARSVMAVDQMVGSQSRSERLRQLDGRLSRLSQRYAET